MQWNIYQASLDPVTGKEQSGTRPVLIISSDSYNKHMPVVTVIPITSKKAARKIYSNEILIEKGKAGLTSSSIALVHQIRTISKMRLGKHYGLLEDKNIRKEIYAALIKHLTIMEYLIDNPI